MLRYADAIVKRGVDKLIDAIGHTPEPQTKNTETPQPQKRMGNDTGCAPQTTDSTTNCGLAEQTITLKDELCDMRYNVLDRTPLVLALSIRLTADLKPWERTVMPGNCALTGATRPAALRQRHRLACN